MAYIYYTLHNSGRIIEGINVNIGAVEYQQFGNRVNKFRTNVVTSEKTLYKEVSATTAVKILKLIGVKY